MDQALTTRRHQAIRSIIGRDETFLTSGPEARDQHPKGTARSTGQEADQVKGEEPAYGERRCGESASDEVKGCPAERW